MLSMVNTSLIALGLVFGMIGTALMALTSIQNPLRRDKGEGLSLGFVIKENPNRPDERKAGQRVCLQRVGLGFVGFGFFLQLFGIL